MSCMAGCCGDSHSALQGQHLNAVDGTSVGSMVPFLPSFWSLPCRRARRASGPSHAATTVARQGRCWSMTSHDARQAQLALCWGCCTWEGGLLHVWLRSRLCAECDMPPSCWCYHLRLLAAAPACLHPQTFEHLASWLEDARQHANPNMTIMLIGNKVGRGGCSRRLLQEAAPATPVLYMYITIHQGLQCRQEMLLVVAVRLQHMSAALAHWHTLCPLPACRLT